MSQVIAGLTITESISSEHAEILTPTALEFIAQLHSRFNARRLELLAARDARQIRLDAGELPDFLIDTKHIRGRSCHPKPT
jgi:malate synthase